MGRSGRSGPGASVESKAQVSPGIEAKRGGIESPSLEPGGAGVATKGRGDRQIRFARVLGLAFIVAGFAAIRVGGSGVAPVACHDLPLPLPPSRRAARGGPLLLRGSSPGIAPGPAPP